VLGGAGQDDAENLLAFTAGEDGLFHGADGTHFEGLLESAEAEAQAERERARTAEGREAGFPAEDGDGLPLEEATAEQQAEVAGAPGRPTRKRRRDGDEHLIGENGEHLDPTRVKKDSHVSGTDGVSVSTLGADVHTLSRKRWKEEDGKQSMTASLRSHGSYREAWKRWARGACSEEQQSTSPRSHTRCRMSTRRLRSGKLRRRDYK
jgi:hypothetical protein